LQKERLIARSALIARCTLANVPVDRKAQAATIRPEPTAVPQDSKDSCATSGILLADFPAYPLGSLLKDATAVKSASSNAKRVLGCLVTGVLVSQVACLPAFATLGEDATTVENDRVQMKAQLRTTAVAGYTVHEIQDSAGTTVREYIGPTGKVFAIAWHGPLLPNFQQTLGKYFAEYNSNANAPRVGRRHLSIQGADLVVHSNGRMRAFYGTAYVPSLLPTNFSVDDIK
jgi:hypothetical protein